MVSLSNSAIGQTSDSTQVISGITQDSFYIIHENIPKSKLWGNSWYTGISYNLSKSHAFTLNLGRTYGKVFTSGGGFNVSTKSWGIGYTYFRKDTISGQTINAFAELSNYFLPPITIRLDYIYDFSHATHYCRPSVGLNFYSVDILYNYSFKLNNERNDFRHGVIFRFKYYFNTDNWEKNFPSRN